MKTHRDHIDITGSKLRNEIPPLFILYTRSRLACLCCLGILYTCTGRIKGRSKEEKS